MTFDPTRVPVGGTVRARYRPDIRWVVVPDGTRGDPAEHVWVSDLGTAAIRDPGRHVDTTRPKDGPSRSYSNAGPVLHRKDDTVRTDIRVMLDVWSGNAETDKAWAK